MQQHFLKSLALPDRYESLSGKLGPEVSRLLISPDAALLRDLEVIGKSIGTRSEGVFVPLYAPSGTGKTTLASSLTVFLPQQFLPTIAYNGEITYDAINSEVDAYLKNVKSNDARIIPVNIDHRESNPPSARELAEIKRFLRKPSIGHRCIVLWPETNLVVAQDVATRYTDITGAAPVPIPLQITGPDRKTWKDIAKTTLELTNKVSKLEDLGVNPEDYEVGEFPSIGAFLRKISNDFNNRIVDLLNQTRKPIALSIVFVSESPNNGVLSQLTSATYYGMLDAHALINATKDSVIGRWWSERRGLLTQTIVQLDAHAFCLPPASAIPVLRMFGDEDLKRYLAQVMPSRGVNRISEDFSRSDLGKYLIGDSKNLFENRGTPSEVSTTAFSCLSEERGFSGGNDKQYNKHISQGIQSYLTQNTIDFLSIKSEEMLSFAPLIPDTSVEFEQHVLCIEYTWRKGEYLSTTNRSTIAQYALNKLKNYARELGWFKD